MKISRSRLENLYRCRLCGYLEIKHDIKPPSIPFTLNIAVDELLKRDFDVYRKSGEVPPVLAKLGKNFVPFKHSDLEIWRDNRSGIDRVHRETGITVYGAIDDLWTNEAGEVVIIDYKATAKASPVTSLGTASYHDAYRRQLDMYAWLVEGQGLKVAKSGYLFYVTARKSADGFLGRLEFDPALIEHDIDMTWIEPFLETAKDVLAGSIPADSPDCNWCDYRKKVSSIKRSEDSYE